jgi:hypothetical protein
VRAAGEVEFPAKTWVPTDVVAVAIRRWSGR